MLNPIFDIIIPSLFWEMPRMKYDIFISYRREGGDTLAQLIYDRLTELGYRVFLDIESLRSGKFNTKLFSVIDECKDVIVILPPHALDRCSNPEDWILMEVSHAIQGRKNIIPVIMKGFEWPDTLPSSISELSDYNGVSDSKDYFDAVIDKLTSLFTAKPALFAKKYHRRQVQDYSYSGRKKVIKKRAALIITAIFLIFAAGVCIYTAHKKHEEAIAYELANNVSIFFYPQDTMSVSEYNDAVSIIKTRLDILNGSSDYTFSSSNTEISVSLPISSFHDLSISDVIAYAVSRPVSLSISADSEHSDALAVTTEDISDISFIYGKQDSIILSDYLMDEADEYYYGIITFSNEMNQKLDVINSDNDNVFYLFQDYTSSNYTGMKLIYDAAKKCCYFTGKPFQYENIQNLFCYNYTHDAFSKALYYNAKAPVEWEDINNIASPGKYQCNEEDLPDDVCEISFIASDNVTDGSYIDAIAEFKRVFDLLERPYSLGHSKEGYYNISIKTTKDHFSQTLANGWSYYSTLKITNNFYGTIAAYNISDIEYVYTSDNSPLIKVTLSDSGTKELADITTQMIADDVHSLYLEYSHTLFATCHIDSAITDGILYFDNMDKIGIDSISDEQKYWINTMAYSLAQSNLSGSHVLQQYKFNSARFNDNRNENFNFNIFLSEQNKELQQTIDGINPSFKMSTADNRLYIGLNLVLSNDAYYKVTEYIEQIFNALNLEKSCYKQIIFYCLQSGTDDHNNIFNVSFMAVDSDPHRYSVIYVISGPDIDSDRDKISQIIDENDFLKQYN